MPQSHGTQQGGLLYDNQHERFSGKLHTRWMGLYRVTETFENGSLQLEDPQGNWLGTKVNGSWVRQYQPEIPTNDKDDIQAHDKS